MAGTIRFVTSLLVVLLALAAPDLSAQFSGQLVRPGDFPTGLVGYWPLESRQKQLTAAGDAQVDTAQAMVGTGSLALDGTGDWLVGDVTADPDFSFGQEHFTIEAWVRLTDISKRATVCSTYRQGSPGGWIFVMDPISDRMTLYDGSGDTRLHAASTGWQTNTWYHVAVVRDGDGIKFFRDGVQQGATQAPGPHYDTGATILQVGAYDVAISATNFLSGWIDELRISKGVARYSSNFTPSTTPFTTDEFTVCLLHFEGADASTEMTDSSHADNYMGQDFSGNGNHLEIPGGIFGSPDTYWEYGQGSSADFEASSSNFLSISDGNQTGLDLAGSYTIAFWFNYESLGSVSRIFTKTSLTQSDGYQLYIHPSGALMGHAAAGASISHSWSPNKWYHLAVVYDSGSSKANFYLNGNLETSQDLATALTDSADPFVVGSFRGSQDFFDGKINDLAVWNSMLTPAQVKSLAFGVDLENQPYRPGDVGTPPTAWWKLNELSGDAIDSSGNGHTGTNTNGVTASGGYLEGAARDFERSSSQYFSTPDHADFNFSGGVFSMSGWFKSGNVTAYQSIYCQPSDVNNLVKFVVNESGILEFFVVVNGSYTVRVFGTTPLKNDTWHHLAVVEDGDVWKVFLDGQDDTNSGGNDSRRCVDETGPVYVGTNENAGGHYVDGAVQDLAIWKGYALTDAEVASLACGLPVQQQGIVSYWPFDEAKEPKAVTANGSAQVSTQQPRFGTGSGLFDGDDNLTVAHHRDFDFGTGDFTIDFWVRLASASGGQYLASSGGNTSTGEWTLRKSDDPALIWAGSSGGGTQIAWSPNADQWYHIAIVRVSGVNKGFIDGVQQWSVADTRDYTSASATDIQVGQSPGGGSYLNGRIDEIRISNTARWSEAFTPPSSAYTTDDRTALLLHMDGTGGSTTFTDASDTGSGPPATVADLVGANDLTAVNGARSALGIAGNATHLERASSQYLEVTGTPADLDLPTSYSLLAWVKRDTASTHFVFSKNGVNGTGYGMSLESSALRGEFFPAGSAGIKSSSSVGSGAWTHLAAVYDQATASVFFNSARETSVAHTTDATDTTTSLRIGARTTNQYYFDGLIDEAIIARRWFRNEEIKALYLRGLHGLSAIGNPPEISVEQPSSVPLTDNASTIDFGVAAPASAGVARTFTIRNDGGSDLSDIQVTVSGTHAADFSLDTTGMSTTVAGGDSTTFSVTFVPGSLGNRNASLEIASNDADENPFEIALAGTGTGTFDAQFDDALDIPITSDGFTATGSTLNLSLAFAPDPFSTLTVVDNTGTDPIVGTFTNLSQGETVTLPFGGTDYRFFVDYFGGTGNDLVLVLQGPGVLDLSFGGTGKVRTEVDAGNDQVRAVAVQPDGKIVAVGHTPGDFAVVRYNVDGTLDTGFGTGGKVITPIGTETDEAHGVALQPNGKIVAVGFAQTSGVRSLAVVRYNADGTLDTSFDGDGKATSLVGASGGEGRDVVLQSDGKIVVGGDYWSGTDTDFALVRYNADGSLDSTFGTGGIVTTTQAGRHDEATCVALAPDGKIVLGGYYQVNTDRILELARYQSNGAPDTSFDGDGVVTTQLGASDFGHDVAVQADGKILLAGRAPGGGGNDIVVLRYDLDGSLDTSFDTDGRVSLAGGSYGDYGHGLALQHDGKILVAGITEDGVAANFFLARLLTDGSLDTSFNGTGIAGASFGDTSSDFAYGMALTPEGRIVLAGLATAGGTWDFAVARFLAETERSATFISPDTVPFTVSSFSGAGLTVNITLGFAPAPGTALTLADNTGLYPASGEFANLAHGEEILLSHGGSDYPFVANYFGGDGNDLVLEWKYSRLLSWGTNTSGALGVAGAPAYADTATQVVATAAIDGRTILSTASGRDFSLAVNADGTVAAWGDNGEGQLGNNSFADAPTPVSVSMGGVLAGKTVVAVSAGSNHSLALCSDGTLAAWGDNEYGQLGDNSTIDRNVPVLVESSGALGGKRVTAIAAGSNHSVALCSDGTVVCWGDNDSRQLGNGGMSRSSVPVAVVTSGILNGQIVKAIAAGYSHTLALLADGTVAAWGANALGQLGNASTSDSNVPVAVDTSVVLDGKTVTAIAAGGNTSHALCDDGTLAAWGNNDHGQIGDGTTGGSYDVPRAVDTSGALNGKTVSHLRAGFRHATAACTDGTAVSWGSNEHGQLGDDNAVTDSSIPVAVTDSILGPEEQFSRVSGGADSDHVVAIVATGPPAPLIQVEDSEGGTISDNGAEHFGAVLVDTTKIRTYTIRNIGTAPMTGIAASHFGSGQADYTILASPASTLAPGDATSLTVAFTPSSVLPRGTTLRINSNVTTNDLNPFDIILSGQGSNSITLSYATGNEVPATTTVAPFSATGKTVNLNTATALGHVPPSGSTLLVLDNRTSEFVGGSFTGLAHGQTVSLEYEGATYPFVVSYYGGDGNDVVLLWAGTRLLAWGPNGSGTIGDGSTDPSLSPTPVTTSGVLAGKTLVSVVAGERHALALCADGTLAAWGANNIGQLGTGSATPSLEPVLVSTGAGSALNGKTVIAIAAGLDFSVALCSDGTVATWGSNSAGQLGQGGGPGGFDDLPVAVTGGAITGKDPAGIAAGIDFVVARCTDGTAVSWGANGAGQLGDGTTMDRSSPVAVDTSGVLSGRSVTSIAAGHFHSLALCDDGTLAAWGDNTFGELGDGTNNGSSLPVAVAASGALSGRTPVNISAGQFHCLALCSDGTLASWGVNTEGQLGTAGPAQSSSPLDITSSGALVGRIVISLACGQGNGMTVLADGSIASWGANTLGQVGDGTDVQRSNPVAIGQGTLVAGERVSRVGSGPTASNGYAIVATAVVPPSGTPVLSTDDATSVTKTGAMLNGVINPNGSNSSVYFEIGTDPGYGLLSTMAQPFSGTDDAPVSQAITGLDPNTTYFVRLAASYNGGLNFAYGDGKTFTTDPDPPSGLAGPASDIGTGGVTLNGTVDPNGRDTTAKFQLSTDADFFSIFAEYDVDDVAAGAVVARSRTITGLVHATTYYYRLIAQNPAGAQSPAEANVVSFTTSNLPPVATTGGTLPVAGSPTSIEVTGSVRASDASTSVTFLYGPLGGGFPYSLAATPDTVTGDTDTPVSAVLPNLQQGRTYQYKVRAENSGGVVEGSVRQFDIESISGLGRVSPMPLPDSDGILTVDLFPSGLAHGWRFFGEQEWRRSGFPALGLPTGDREIEYRPVPGWINPPSEIVSIVTDVSTRLERNYFEAGGGETGSLTVTIVPEAITSGPDRAQWRLLGEDGSAWRDSGATFSGLSPGNYLVECKPVPGRSTPPNTSVPVVAGQTSAPTIVYRLPDAATGATPVAIGIETVTAGGDLPYSYVGQIRSSSGSGSGFAVKDRVVATAAHVVWNDITESAVEGLQWIHQRHHGTYEPEPIEPRGFYVFDGYAAQRIADNSPGDSSPQSQHLDVAAIYFNENAARGGSGGFLASDLDDNEFLLSNADKLLVGYPVDGVDPAIRGRMHSTTPFDINFVRGYGRTFTTSDIGSFGGNSGGPLCVQHEGGPFYPAAVYLGGNAQTVVRAIDSEVVDLFDRAETSGNGGSNNTGGGITHTGVTSSGGVDTPGSLQIHIKPDDAVDAGAGWRIRPETTYRNSGDTVGSLKANRYKIELATVAGYQPPDILKVRVKGGQAKSITFTYAPEVIPEAGISVRGNGRIITNGDAAPSLLDHTDFGTVAVGSGLLARTFTVQNTGSADLSLGSVLVDGTHPDDFSVLLPPGATIQPGNSTTFTIRFEPSAPGIRSASISFANNVTGSTPFTFLIQGNDTADSDSNGFTDGEEAALAELLAQFTVGQSVELDLSFLQLVPGQILELLNLPPGLSFDAVTKRIEGTITDKATSPQVEIRKLGGATPVPSVTVDFPVFVRAKIEATGLRSFPTTIVRKRSRPQTLILTNAGELPLDGLSVRTIGKAAKDYLVTQPLENALDPGASTTCTVRFKPRKKGTRRASIIILSSTEPKTVPVSGRGKVKKKKKKK